MIKRDFSLNNPKEIERRKKISKTMKRISSSPEWRIMMSERLKGENNPNYGKPLLKEHRKKLSEAHKGKMSDWQKGEKAYWYGKQLSEETKKNMSNSHKGKTSGMKGKKHSKKRNRKMSEIMKKVWQNPEYKEKVLKKSREGANVKPNNFEKKGFAIVSGLFPNEYMLNVKGEVMILGGKVPDIVNVNGQKKVIELFGDYWHSDKHITKKGCYEDTEEGRKRYFKKYGYSTLIIWENELKNIEAVKQKITDFHMTNTRD